MTNEKDQDSLLGSDDLHVSGDEQLNDSLSSSEFAQEIKDKVKEHFRKRQQTQSPQSD